MIHFFNLQSKIVNLQSTIFSPNSNEKQNNGINFGFVIVFFEMNS
jgi:hypothetical protein